MCGVAGSSVAALAKQSVISPLPSQGKLSNFCCILYYETRGRPWTRRRWCSHGGRRPTLWNINFYGLNQRLSNNGSGKLPDEWKSNKRYVCFLFSFSIILTAALNPVLDPGKYFGITTTLRLFTTYVVCLVHSGQNAHFLTHEKSAKIWKFTKNGSKINFFGLKIC